jgi:hypothetical protein
MLGLAASGAISRATRAYRDPLPRLPRVFILPTMFFQYKKNRNENYMKRKRTGQQEE